MPLWTEMQSCYAWLPSVKTTPWWVRVQACCVNFVILSFAINSLVRRKAFLPQKNCKLVDLDKPVFTIFEMRFGTATCFDDELLSFHVCRQQCISGMLLSRKRIPEMLRKTWVIIFFKTAKLFFWSCVLAKKNSFSPPFF